MKSLLLFFLVLISIPSFLSAQDIPVSMKNEALYDFVDELATAQFIHVNQVVKPYTQAQIKQWLTDAEVHYNRMSKRQQAEWRFYKTNMSWPHLDSTVNKHQHSTLIQREFGVFSLAPLGVYSDNGKVAISLKPVLNAQFLSNDKGMFYHRSYGAEFLLHTGNWSAYGNLQDYAESEQMYVDQYLVNHTGGNYKNLDYSDMRGGLSYANSWVSVGMVKDYLSWGTQEHGANIISDQAPSFGQLRLKIHPVDWFEFNYVHGWLVSNVIDSTDSYIQSNGIHRDVMHGKYIAANMLTLYPWRSLNLSFGNSIVYGADEAQWQYLNPFMFYKSVDHTYNSTDGAGANVGQNSQMFFDVSFRGIKHVLLYYTLFVDELKMERWKHADEHNFYSYKAGIKVSNLLPNVFFGAEYTHTVPITYQHDILTTTFASNDYNLGHYLRDNAEELYAYVQYKPLRNLQLKLDYCLVRKGEEYGYVRQSPDLVKHSFIEDESYRSSSWEFKAQYLLAYEMLFYVGVGQSETSGADVELYTPDFNRGKHFNFSFGANIGF